MAANSSGRRAARPLSAAAGMRVWFLGAPYLRTLRHCRATTQGMAMVVMVLMMTGGARQTRNACGGKEDFPRGGGLDKERRAQVDPSAIATAMATVLATLMLQGMVFMVGAQAEDPESKRRRKRRATGKKIG